jgi:3-hydroxyacyl-[acyl-carrier-protein] dehydratase
MQDILDTIPHRPPFLFIDEIVALDDDGAVAQLQVRADMPHFAGHYPGNPIMPGVLICEAVFQTAAYYMAKRLQRTWPEAPAGHTPILARIIEARFKRQVAPGDVLRLEARYKEGHGRFHFMSGRVSSDGKAVATLEYALAMVPGEGEGA